MKNNIGKHIEARQQAPRHLRIYEWKRAKDRPIDYITVVFSRASCFMGKDWIGRVYYVACNNSPGNPMCGFYQHGEAMRWEFSPCGSKVQWKDISPELRRVLLIEYAELWGVSFQATPDGFVIDWRPLRSRR